MNISQLITALEQIKAEHGDLPVSEYDSDTREFFVVEKVAALEVQTMPIPELDKPMYLERFGPKFVVFDSSKVY